MPLSEFALKNLKPKDKRYLVRDDEGLYIEVNPTGRKYWKVRYMVDGKAKKVMNRSEFSGGFPNLVQCNN